MNPTTTEDVLRLVDGQVTSAILGAAMELGLFWLLAEKPLDAAGVAQALKIPVHRCRYWLQVLAEAGLLEQESGHHVPSQTARRAVLGAYSQASWALLAQEARLRSRCLADLPLHLSEPGSILQALGQPAPDYVEELNENDELARRFTRMLYELHQPLAEAIAERLDLENVRQMIDLGGGSGVVSHALLRRNTGLTAVIVDLPGVCQAARLIAAENSLQDRIGFHPADFLQDELPVGFDLVLECDVGVYTEALFEKVWKSLAPKGRFLIIDQFAPREGVAPPARMHWAFCGSLNDPAFAYPTAARVQALLEQAGFRLFSGRPLPPASGRSRFCQGMTVLEAVKGGPVRQSAGTSRRNSSNQFSRTRRIEGKKSPSREGIRKRPSEPTS